MNYSMIKRLVLKDWYFLRYPIAGYLVAGALSLALIQAGGSGLSFAGSILLLTILISVGIHLAMLTVINERKEQTLSFVMSLPISAREYTIAKILANLLIFLVPWVTLLIGALTLLWIANSGGLIPFTTIILTEIFVSYCLTLGVALVTESQNWTVGAIVVGNLALNGVLYYVSHIPTIASAMKGHAVIWNQAPVTLMVAEVVAIGLLLGLTLFFQGRKTDFL
jgi:ABC-type transport system involved in multi-copper enzyme maturation permease subunit